MGSTTKGEWVIGRYTGDHAKHVKALADAGVGYFVRQESGKGTNYSVEVAFRRVITLDEPRPEHLDATTALQAEKLEKLRNDRTGVPKEYRNLLS